MSLSGSLSSALSGLQVNARMAEIIATNVANKVTPGYGRRELQMVARCVGGSGQGVQATAVLRVTDRDLASDRRSAEADAAGKTARSDFLAAMEAAIGAPTDSVSLGGRIAALDASLLAAASRPDSQSRLGEVLAAANGLAAHIGHASRTLQEQRENADGAIARDVGKLNATLAGIERMNGQIRSQVAAGHDASALMDQRQQLVDELAAIVPIREVLRDNEEIALVSTGGAVLLDGKAARFGFTEAGIVTPDMSLASGALSGLTMNGRPVDMVGASGLLSGGTLAASFGIRDVEAPQLQAQLDAVARDLMSRFSDPALDATLRSGAPGLFTDADASFDPANEVGLAARLVVNAAADPAKGGALWRLRDGLGASEPGVVGESALLTAMQHALVAPRSPVSGQFMPGGRSFSLLAADLLSGVSTNRLSSDEGASFASAKSDALREQELGLGVDTDQQMQQLLLVEQAYAANAKVITSVDEMLQILLGI